jgi:uncharacterized protein YfiM (DUF2279 family)
MLTKTIIAGLILASSMSYAADAKIKEDAAQVNTACSADAATAGCGTEVVGKGLLKCLHAYKKANKGFKFSESCKASLKQIHTDRKAEKAETK